MTISSHHYSVDFEKRVIHLREGDYSKADKILPQAMTAFNGKVYVKIDPWQFGEIFVCYRNALDEILSFSCTYDAEGDLEMGDLHKMHELMNSSDYAKVKVVFDLCEKFDPSSKS